MATKKKTTKKGRTTKKTARKPAPKRPSANPRDPRLPAVGQTLTREFKGRTIEVKVTDDGFEFEGESFRSISAVARHITGYMISGPVFFRLDQPEGE